MTRIFEGASSSASVLARADTEARNTVDSPRFGMGSLTDADVDIRIAPPPRPCIDGTAARTMRSALNSSRSAASCHARSSKEMAAPAGGPPELVINRSMPPKRSIVDRIHRSIASAERTSAAMANTWAPVSRSIFPAACAMDSPSRDDMETIAPSSASAWATP
ncbi:MAG: hypothetical protein A3H96_05175 [Acidobacteria bacterium RIFCSPLOWO2_02_FULL_67_36]|nr:MAG: hypothetical protein A3H96_05175 [Acidobacteria bacterium RIFCSPLOWO2_02_FULL_67_36]